MPPKRSQKTQKKITSKGLESATTTEKSYFELYDTNTTKYGPNTAVLYLVGRFYEIYDYIEKATGVSRTNVQRVAELCGCTVEHKPCTDPNYSRLFWGFPMDSLRKFERMLVSAGMSVVVHTQEKNAAGDVINRPFEHIASPGTYMDEDGLQVRKEEQCLLTVYVEPWNDERRGYKYWSIATSAFDVSTGDCESTEAEIQIIDTKPVFDIVQPFWSLHPPAEVIWVWASALPCPSDSEITNFTSPSSRIPLIHKVIVDPKSEASKETERIRHAFLEDVYKPTTSLSLQEFLGIRHYPQMKRSLFYLLQFIKDHNPSYLKALTNHTVWAPEKHVLLGNAALQQLGMLPLNSEKAQESLFHWLQKAETAMGRRVLRERLLKPIADVEELEHRQARIASYRSQLPTELVGMLRGMGNLERLYRRFQLGIITVQDLYALTTTYEKAHSVLQFLKGKPYDVQDDSLMTHVLDHLRQFSHERIQLAIESGSTHPWKRGIHADLDEYEDRWKTIETSMTAIRDQWNIYLGESDGIKWMIREDGPFTFYGTQRRTTAVVNACKLKQQTVTSKKNGSSKSEYILETDEIVATNKQAIELKQVWNAAILEKLLHYAQTFTNHSVASKAGAQLVHCIGTVDTELTLAIISDKHNYVRPTYMESTEATPAGVELIDLRHPIIERITTTTYIPHSLRLGTLSTSPVDAESSHGILLYGVNAAGKSSLGKALGLAVLMAQVGMPVPATTMKLIPYTSLFTRILGNDNLWAGMSSFVVEMTEFRSILRSATPRTLVIGDELCAGTETASATSIVAAGVEHLAEHETHFLFATHLHELAEIVQTPRITMYHLSVHSEPKSQTLIYDRKLKTGCGSPMYGLEVCRGLDMDYGFLEKAFMYRRRFFEAAPAHTSRYNASLVVDACGVCGSRDALETHHIRAQATAAEDGTVAPGVHKNHKSNLVPLCDSCHTKLHQGLYEIKGWKMTSEGRRLDFTVPE